ncbi:MAG: AgmX/PglI C-terminal domain-containing protein [Deltaproteobacteria bacterium]|nr:AgmX/PglI C-terminal domain-containing protein [Deltaproteobacteria bacterium]
MSEPSVLQVFVFRDGAYVGNEIFTEPEITIGRGPGVDLALDDDQVAPQHAVLAHERGQATLLDLNSGFGSSINRTAIQHSYVTARDEIQIGGFTLKIKFVGQKPKFSARPAPAPAPAPADLSSHAELPVDEIRHEMRTEVVQTGNPAAAPSDPRRQRQSKIPTAMVRAPSAESIEDLISSELGGITASLEISGSDVVHARSVTTNEAPKSPGKSAAPKGKSAPVPTAPQQSQRPAQSSQPRPPGPSTLAGLLDEATVSMQNAQTRPTIGDQGGGGFDTLESALDSAFLGEAPVVQPVPTKTIERLPPAPLQSAPQVSQSPRASAPKPAAVLPDGGPTGPIALRPDPAVAQTSAPSPFGAAPVQHHTPAHDDDDDHDDDGQEHDDDIQPPFSLLKTMVQKADYPSGGAASLEVICFAKEDVRSSTLLGRVGERYVLGREVGRERAPRAGHPGLKLARITKIGEAVIEFPSSAEGMILDGDKRIGLDQLKVPQNAVSKKGDVFRVTLSTKANATMTIGDVGFHLRFVRPPPVNQLAHDKSSAFDASILKAMGSSVVAHLLILAVVAMSSPGVSYSEVKEQWAEVPKEDIRDVEVPPEPPPPEPEPEPEPEKPEEVTEDQPEPEPEPETPKPKKRDRVADRGEPKGVPKEEVKNAGVLGAMGKLNLAAPGKKSMVQAVSNIDAVKAPGGSNFRVGALVGKTPSSEVSVGGGGGGGPLLTKGGAALLAGGTGFATIGKRSGTKVRGTVNKVNATGLVAKGSISREEVAAVINKHLSEIQYCYEKTLLKEPGLKGKLMIEWVINVDGSVGKVKQQSSTLSNAQVASCIMSSLKRWTFPKPRGGIVVVSYPFIFSSV